MYIYLLYDCILHTCADINMQDLHIPTYTVSYVSPCVLPFFGEAPHHICQRLAYISRARCNQPQASANVSKMEIKC